jgi:hypothetical protein
MSAGKVPPAVFLFAVYRSLLLYVRIAVINIDLGLICSMLNFSAY